MKCVPVESMTPSGPEAPLALTTRSRLNVCSLAAWYSGFAVLVMPCSGRSTAAMTQPFSAKACASAKESVRSRVMPCSKMITGQPAAGLTPAAPAAPFGMVTSNGIALSAFFSGIGLKRVRLRSLAGSASGAGGAAAARHAVRNTAESVLIPPGACGVGMYE